MTMAPAVRILDINPGSDGDGRKWPKHHLTRNDDHYCEHVANKFWIKDLRGEVETNVIYRLNKLPHGYAGFERVRPDGERIDYFLYGHPSGRFDSVKKFYPHFKHLMDYGVSEGCTCDLCMAGNEKKRANESAAIETKNLRERSSTPPRRSKFFAAQNQPKLEPGGLAPNLISPFNAKPRGRPRKYPVAEDHSELPQKSKLVDAEGTPDIYETLIAKMKQGDREDVVDVAIEERMSPDWRGGNALSKTLFKQWRSMPRYVPRVGEIVLFVRRISPGETIEWDTKMQMFRRRSQESQEWLEQPKWEAGVVTQMPQETISSQDLLTEQEKQRGLTYSGFRIEPLSKPGSDSKPFTKQHKYVPLHLIRPFVYWQECLKGVPEKEWHPTVWHALSVMSSFCVVGRCRFKGIWPHATVFCRGVYIGSELIMPGDVVRLLPRHPQHVKHAVTDIMVVTAIRLRFVNLDLEEDDMAPESDLPYQICLHISGRVYTLDPSRSFDGVGKISVNADSENLPARVSGLGVWYHYSDPSNPAARIEVPFTRILGRCFEDTAMKAWFEPRTNVLSPGPAKSLTPKPAGVKDQTSVSRGLRGAMRAREYSRQNDSRITSEDGRSWFWADTRIDQLDLHEVNGRYVGAKHERTAEELRKWRMALKALDGKKGALEQYQADKQAQVERVKEEPPKGASAYGMVAASRDARTESPSATEAERIEEGEGEEEDDDDDEDEDEDEDNEQSEGEGDQEDAMEVDEESQAAPNNSESAEDEESEPESSPHKKIEVITLSDSEDEDERVTTQLAGELAKKIRANDSRLR